MWRGFVMVVVVKVMMRIGGELSLLSFSFGPHRLHVELLSLFLPFCSLSLARLRHYVLFSSSLSSSFSSMTTRGCDSGSRVSIYQINLINLNHLNQCEPQTSPITRNESADTSAAKQHRHKLFIFSYRVNCNLNKLPGKVVGAKPTKVCAELHCPFLC